MIMVGLREVLKLVLLVLSLSSFVLAVPTVTYTSPTPSDGATVTSIPVTINTTIVESDLKKLIYNWNGTNYTLFNDSFVVLFNFDNQSSLGDNATYVVDMTRYKNNGTFVNGATYMQSGKYRSAIQLDGINDYVSVPDVSSLDFGTGGFAVSFWVNASSLSYSSSAQLIVKRVSGGGNFEVQVSNGRLETYLEGTGQGTLNLLSTYNLSQHLNEWVFVTLNRVGTTAGLYVNGLLNISGTSAHNVDNNNPLNIGRDVDGGNEFFNGSIDDVRIYNRGLSNQEVYQLYVSNLRKLNTTQWEFYVAQNQNITSTLSESTYSYFVTAKDSSASSSGSTSRIVTYSTSSSSSVPEWDEYAVLGILVIAFSGFFYMRKEEN